MAISKLSFDRGQVLNPLDDIGDDLLKYGASLHQQEKDRLAAARQDEILGMQKAEYQMKVDAEKRALEELANTKAFNVGLAKPREMAEANAIYNQNNNPLLQKQINDIAYSPNDTEADTARKTQAQEALGKLGSTMANDPAYHETRLQQGTRLLAAMGDKAPLSAIKQVEEMRAAEIASEAAKAKDAREAGSKAQEDLVKLGIEAMKLEGRNGTTITADDGTVLSLGGHSKVVNPLSFTTKQAENQLKSYEEGMKTLTSRMDALGAGKAPDIKTAQRVMAMDALNKYAAEKYDPVLLANIITTKFQNDPSFYEIWKDKQTGITLTPEELKTLDMKREADAQVNGLKAQEAALSNILAQAKSTGGSGKSILEAYAPYYQGKIAKADAESKLLAMPLEKRQMQATANAMGSILTPKEDTDVTTKGKGSAVEIDAGNLMPKQKEALDTTVNYVRNKHGLNSAQAYAIAANGLSESGFDSKATGDKGTAAGYFQHRLDRQEALKQFAGEKDISKIPLEKQLDFVIAEMAQRKPSDAFVAKFKAENPGYQGFVSQLDEFKSFTSPKDAAAYFSANYEVAKGNSTKEGEAARRGELANKLFENQPQQEATDALSRALANGRNALSDKSKIQQLFAEASTAPDAPIMPKVTSKNVPKPGYELLADAAVDIGKTAKSMVMQSPVGMLFNGNSALKPAAAVLNNTAAGMLQIAGSPYTAAKLFTDWMVTGKTEDSVFDANAKQAYTTAITALNEYGIKNPTEQQIIMLVSDMMAPGGAAKTVKGVLPKAVDVSEEALANILKSIKNDTAASKNAQNLKANQYEVPIGPSAPRIPEAVLRSPEELAAAEIRRKRLLQSNQYETPIGPRPAGLQ